MLKPHSNGCFRYLIPSLKKRKEDALSKIARSFKIIRVAMKVQNLGLWELATIDYPVW
jgi:hypothetical protein